MIKRNKNRPQQIFEWNLLKFIFWDSITLLNLENPIYWSRSNPRTKNKLWEEAVSKIIFEKIWPKFGVQKCRQWKCPLAELKSSYFLFSICRTCIGVYAEAPAAEVPATEAPTALKATVPLKYYSTFLKKFGPTYFQFSLFSKITDKWSI